MENKEIQEKLEGFNQLLENEDIRKMWIKTHTPYRKILAVGRNEICPFCGSGKKFKHCECYEKYKANPYIKGGDQAGV